MANTFQTAVLRDSLPPISPDSSTTPRPALPLDVIEAVIEHSSGDTPTLLNFALTCQDLYHRSTVVLYAHVKLDEHFRFLGFFDTLRAKPQLQSLVRAVEACIVDSSRFPLLSLLPNLSYLYLYRHPRDIWMVVSLDASVLHCCRQFGCSIRRLTLDHMKFHDESVFLGFILSFSGVEQLNCNDVTFEERDDSDVKDSAAFPQLQRLFEPMKIRTLEVNDL